MITYCESWQVVTGCIQKSHDMMAIILSWPQKSSRWSLDVEGIKADYRYVPLIGQWDDKLKQQFAVNIQNHQRLYWNILENCFYCKFHNWFLSTQSWPIFIFLDPHWHNHNAHIGIKSHSSEIWISSWRRSTQFTSSEWFWYVWLRQAMALRSISICLQGVLPLKSTHQKVCFRQRSDPHWGGKHQYLQMYLSRCCYALGLTVIICGSYRITQFSIYRYLIQNH